MSHQEKEKKPLFFVYGLIAYAIGVTGLMGIIFAMAGLVPLGLGAEVGNAFPSVLINVFLVGLFAVQHTIMARPRFKEWVGKVIDPAVERSHFVLGAGLIPILFISFWQPIDGVVWSVFNDFPVIRWLPFVAGWAYLFASTFAINHWDLFGLRQTWLAARGVAYQKLVFKENWMYRYSRHPIMLGALMGFCLVPEMSVNQALLAVLMSTYVFVGIRFEERDLLREFGDSYQKYRDRVGMFVSLPRNKSH